MIHVHRAWIGVVVVSALLTTACGDTDSAKEQPVTRSDEADRSQTGGQSDDGRSTGAPQETATAAGDDGSTVVTGPIALSVFEIEADERTRSAVASLIDQLGADGAFDAVALAVDAGYSADQLLGAAERATLEQDGTIRIGSAVETPESGPAEYFDRGADESSAGADEGTGLTLIAFGLGVEDYRDRVGETYRRAGETGSASIDDAVATVSQEFLYAVIELAKLGFSAEEILDALLFGATLFYAECASSLVSCPESQRSDALCTALIFPDGQLVEDRPGRCPRDTTIYDEYVGPSIEISFGNETPADADSPPDEFRFYSGPATVELTYEGDSIRPTTMCSVTPIVDLELEPIDEASQTRGTAVLTVRWMDWVATPGADAAGDGCQQNVEYSVPTTGFWEDDHFTVAVLNPRRGQEAEITGRILDGAVVVQAALTWDELPETGSIEFELPLQRVS